MTTRKAWGILIIALLSAHAGRALAASRGPSVAPSAAGAGLPPKSRVLEIVPTALLVRDGAAVKRIVRLVVDAPETVHAEAAVKAWIAGQPSSWIRPSSPSSRERTASRCASPRSGRAGQGAIRGPLDRRVRTCLAQPGDHAGPRPPLERLSLPSFPHRHRLHRAPIARRPKPRRIPRFRHQVLPGDRTAIPTTPSSAGTSRSPGPWRTSSGRGRNPMCKALVDLIKAGRVELSALYLQVSDCFAHEEIVRSVDAARDLARRYGFEIRVGHEQRRQRLRLVPASDLPPGRGPLFRQRHQRDPLPGPAPPAQSLLVGVARRQPHPPLERRALSLRQLRAPAPRSDRAQRPEGRRLPGRARGPRRLSVRPHRLQRRGLDDRQLPARPGPLRPGQGVERALRFSEAAAGHDERVLRRGWKRATARPCPSTSSAGPTTGPTASARRPSRRGSTGSPTTRS